MAFLCSPAEWDVSVLLIVQDQNLFVKSPLVGPAPSRLPRIHPLGVDILEKGVTCDIGTGSCGLEVSLEMLGLVTIHSLMSLVFRVCIMNEEKKALWLIQACKHYVLEIGLLWNATNDTWHKMRTKRIAKSVMNQFHHVRSLKALKEMVDIQFILCVCLKERGWHCYLVGKATACGASIPSRC